MKNVLDRKHRAFVKGDKTDKRKARGEVRVEVKRAKLQYKKRRQHGME